MSRQFPGRPVQRSSGSNSTSGRLRSAPLAPPATARCRLQARTNASVAFGCALAFGAAFLVGAARVPHVELTAELARQARAAPLGTMHHSIVHACWGCTLTRARARQGLLRSRGYGSYVDGAGRRYYASTPGRRFVCYAESPSSNARS